LEKEREDDGVAGRRDSGESDAQDRKHEIHLVSSEARIDDARRFGKLYFAK